jgi:hypothetical protein
MCAGLVYYTYRRLGKIAPNSWPGCIKVLMIIEERFKLPGIDRKPRRIVLLL